MKEDQATEETVGSTEFMGLIVPCFNKSAKWGIFPSATNLLTKLYGVPSRPITTTFLPFVLEAI